MDNQEVQSIRLNVLRSHNSGKAQKNKEHEACEKTHKIRKELRMLTRNMPMEIKPATLS